jgi:hypothetical protein
MRSKKKLETERYWRTVLSDWQESGLNLKQFAEDKELNYKALLKWKVRFHGCAGSAKIKDVPKVNLQTTDLVPVHLIQADKESVSRQQQVDMPAPLELLLLNGRTLRFDKSCPLEFLSSLIPVAEAHTHV